MTKKILKSLIVITMLISLSCQSTQFNYKNNIESYSELKDFMSQYIVDNMNHNRIEGLSISLISKDKVIWSEGFGYSNLEDKIVATDKTVYGVGSISKLLTATAIMQLKERGLLDLDTPIKEYIPDFYIKSRYENSKEITIRMLMTHRSGLPRDKGSYMFGGNNEDFRSLVDYLKSTYTSFPPLEKVSYSNIAISLLGIIIENVSGENFLDYCDTNILQPLNMSSSSFIPLSNRDDIDREFISMAHPVGEGRSIPDYALRDIPAGSLNGSVVDMSNYISMVLNGGTFNGLSILDSDSINQMLTIQNPQGKYDIKMGLNFFLSGYDDLEYMGKIAYHGGSTLYHLSNMIIAPDAGLGVIISINTNSGHEVIDDISTMVLKQAYNIETGIPPVEIIKERDLKVTPLTSDREDEIVGDYITEFGITKIYRDGNKIKAILNGNKLEIVSHEDGWFSVKKRILGIFTLVPKSFTGIYFRFESVGGKDTIITKKDNSFRYSGERIDKTEITDAWKDRVGDYKILNAQKIEQLEPLPDSITKLLIWNNYLVFGNNLVTPLSDSEAIIPLIRQAVSIKTENGEEILEISGFKYKKIN